MIVYWLIVVMGSGVSRFCLLIWDVEQGINLLMDELRLCLMSC